MDYDSDAYDEPNEDIYLRPEAGHTAPAKLDPAPKSRSQRPRLQQLESPYRQPPPPDYNKHQQNRTSPACYDGERYTHIWEMPLPTPGEV